MTDDKPAGKGQPAKPGASIPNRILGSLRDALNAASREDRSGEISLAQRNSTASVPAPSGPAPSGVGKPATAEPSAAPGPTNAGPGAGQSGQESRTLTRDGRHVELSEPAARRGEGKSAAHAPRASAPTTSQPVRTQALRGKVKVVHSAFHQDPVVGWLVVVGGAGLGAFRPIFEGNNSIGRGKGQRIPIDFGDETISAEEQAFIRYDSSDRSFLFVPNLSKTNIVAVNDKKPTGAVKLELMDVITMGRTQLAFVPFCGEEFDWSELSDLKE